MFYYMQVRHRYITEVIRSLNKSDDYSFKQITKEQYDEIVELFVNKPTPREGYDFRLTIDLTWEEYKLPSPDATLNDTINALNKLGVITNDF